MIYIHKGDDTNFENQKFLTLNINSNYDMSNWSCVVSLAGINKTFQDLSSGSLQIIYTKEDTQKMPYGTSYLSVVVTDEEGRVKTIANTIPVRITNEVVSQEEETIAISESPIEETIVTLNVSGGSGEGGTTNHAMLSNLGYAQSGHVGFASSQDVVNLQEQLDNKQPTGDYALSSDIPTQMSQLINNSGFITNTVNDLINYYTNNEVYTKTEINDIINNFASLKIKIVDQLPTENISTSTFYLIAKAGQEENNIYDEYIYINNQWELIGSTAVDLTVTDWVGVTKNIVTGLDVGSSDAPVEYSLEDYLPSDNYSYEVMFAGRVQTGTTSGYSVGLALKTSYIDEAYVLATFTTANKATIQRASNILPVGADRKVSILRSTYWKDGVINLDAIAYRKIGV